MSENERLTELYAFNILDTESEKDLDVLAEIASAICDTPISLISLIDKDRQWFKSNIGLDINETPRQDSFCQHAIHAPKEVLVIDNPLQDERFKNNPLVLGNPNIRFYAGAPLETSTGHVLGTLCIIDNKPNQISERQKKALQLLATKAMDFLNTRKLLFEKDSQIANNLVRLQKLTDHLPGAIYQLEMNMEGKMSMPFISKGITEIHPSLLPEKLKDNLSELFKVIHPEDLNIFKESIAEKKISGKNWFLEFRIISENSIPNWVMARAKVEKKPDGTTIWYGVIRDINESKEYVNTLEQILFDISHVLRRPVANLLGLTTIFEDEKKDEKIKSQAINHIKTASQELDKYLKKLNRVYYDLQKSVNDTNREKPIPED